MSTVDLEVYRSLAVTASLCAQSAEQRAEAQRLIERIDAEVVRRLQSKAVIGQHWVTDSQDGEPMASMTLSAMLAELTRLRANGLPPSQATIDAASQLTADSTAALATQVAATVALQALYDAYVIAHP